MDQGRQCSRRHKRVDQANQLLAQFIKFAAIAAMQVWCEGLWRWSVVERHAQVPERVGGGKHTRPLGHFATVAQVDNGSKAGVEQALLTCFIEFVSTVRPI